MTLRSFVYQDRGVADQALVTCPANSSFIGSLFRSGAALRLTLTQPTRSPPHSYSFRREAFWPCFARHLAVL